MAESLLDRNFLERLEYLYIVARERFIGHVASERLTRRFGVGIEFAEHRAYAPGDDFRYIDWATYARRGDLQIKLFTQEQSAHVYLAVDASGSMALGRPQKLLFAKRVAAAIGYVALANLDPVTLLVVGDGVRQQSRTFEGRGQLHALLGFLDGIEAEGPTRLGHAARQFVQQHKARRGVVVMISDFLDRAGYEEAMRRLHHDRFELVAVRVNDREEVDPPFTGDLELSDSETGERVMIELTPATVRAYQERLAAHYAELERLCKALRRAYLPVVTDQPFEEVVFDVFRRGGVLR